MNGRAATQPVADTRKSADSALSTCELDVSFGGTHALVDVSVDLPTRTVSGIIGPNGAGKTTLLNCISGLVPATAGQVFLSGEDITNLPAHRRPGLGLGRTFQGAQFVRELNVIDNVMTGGHIHLAVPFFDGLLGTPRARRRERECREAALEALATLGLAQHAYRYTQDLPFGIQKRIDLARALMSHPTCLLLDEPMAGLSLDEKDQLVEVIRELQAEQERTIVIVEHDMRIVNLLCAEVVVLDAGRKLAAGKPDIVFSDPRVIEAFTGAGARQAAAAQAETSSTPAS
jgi:branched-chain amino acid transport system ATP-binding protein